MAEDTLNENKPEANNTLAAAEALKEIRENAGKNTDQGMDFKKTRLEGDPDLITMTITTTIPADLLGLVCRRCAEDRLPPHMCPYYRDGRCRIVETGCPHVDAWQHDDCRILIKEAEIRREKEGG